MNEYITADNVFIFYWLCCVEHLIKIGAKSDGEGLIVLGNYSVYRLILRASLEIHLLVRGLLQRQENLLIFCAVGSHSWLKAPDSGPFPIMAAEGLCQSHYAGCFVGCGFLDYLIHNTLQPIYEKSTSK